MLDFLIYASRELMNQEVAIDTGSTLAFLFSVRRVRALLHSIPRNYIHYLFWNIVKFIGFFGFFRVLRSKKIPIVTLLRAMSFLNLANTFLVWICGYFPNFPKLICTILLKTIVYSTISKERVMEKKKGQPWYLNTLQALIFAAVESCVPWYVFGRFSSSLRNLF